MHRKLFSKYLTSFDESYISIVFSLYILLFPLALSYGIYGDEPQERLRGAITTIYVLDKFDSKFVDADPILSKFRAYPSLERFDDGDHGPFFDGIAVALERLLGIGNDGDERKIYFFRHLLTFLVNLVGVVAVYHLAKRRFDDWRIGLLAATFLVLSPRFFAESFYNSKDVVFMSFFALSTYTAISFILKPTWKTAIWHSLATAIAIDVRIMAVVIPAMTILLLGLRIAKREIPWRKTLGLAILYLSLAAVVVVICWPWLWADPWGRFVEAFTRLSSYPWKGEYLYFSTFIAGIQTPWHYIPVWIAITTPLLYLGLFVVGFGATLKTLVQRHWRLWQGEQELQDLIFLGLFTVPILAVIILQSTLYDGWRQMYFVYPAFLLLSIKGWTLLRSHSYTQPLLQKWAKPALTTILCISFAWTTVWMVRAHPLQNVYFNALAGKNWKSKFDVDYWGLSNRMALEYILKRDNRNLVRIFTPTFPNAGISFPILMDIFRARAVETNLIGESDYIINHYRNNIERYDASPNGQFVHYKDIKVGGEIITSIFRRKGELPHPPEIAINERIDYSNSGKGKYFLMGVGAQETAGTGWSYPESWGTWSDGAIARIILPIPKGKPSSLDIEVSPFLVRGHSRQKIEVLIDGVSIKEVSLTKSGVTHINVELPKLATHYVIIEFRFPDSVSPQSLGMGDDKRKLGGGIVATTFKL